MGLKDSIVRALAIRYARGKIKDLRSKDRETTMGRVLKALDGWKLVIAVVAMAGVQAWDMAHNGHTGNYVGILLTLLGWTPGAEWGVIARDVATHVGALIAIGHKLYKAQQQMKAGATVAETLTTEGVIKQALVDGVVETDDDPTEAGQK